jgi:L-ascorbate metabolism protein UlaG (beta-lactamase superfamily)
MEVTYLGHSSFKIKGKDTTIVIDPYDENMTGLKFPKQDADIVIISHHHPDHDKVTNITNIKKVIDGPGEYEVAGVSIIGISSFHDDKKGALRGKNTIYIIELEYLRLLHLGDLGHPLTDDQKKQIGVIDILMIPVGGYYTIDAKTAAEVVKQIGASIVIPMHYHLEGLNPELAQNLSPVEDFITESGLRVEKLPKLNIKKDAINSEEEYAVILEKK